MDKNSDEAIKQNKSITKTSATIDTPTIKMSVETESTDKTGVQTSSEKDNSGTLKINFTKWRIILFNLLTLSSVLFIFSVGAGIAEVYFCINTTDNEWTKVFIGVFSIISLILSVIVKLNTDEEKRLKLMFVKSIIKWFDKKEISINELKDLLECCEL